MPRFVSDLVDHTDFVHGLVFGVGALAVLVVCWFVRTPRRPLPLAGAAACAAAILAIGDTNVAFDKRTTLVVSLVLLAAAGTLSALLGGPFVLRVVLSAPGAAVLAAAAPSNSQGFVRPFVTVAVAFAAAAATQWPRWSDASALGPLLLAVTCAGVYVCAPDTEHAAIALGAVLPVGLAGWPWRIADFTGGGAAASVGLVVWLAATDGAARPGAIVGGAGCLGVLVLVPALRRVGVPLAGRVRTRRAVSVMMTVVIVHCIVVAVCSRVAGLRGSAGASAVIVTIALASAVLLLQYVIRAGDPQPDELA